MKKCIFIIIAMMITLTMLSAEGEVSSDKSNKFCRYAYRDAFQAVGLEAKNTMDGETILKLWQDFFANKDKVIEPVGDNLYGITYKGEEANPSEKVGYSYFVGIQVQDKAECPEGMVMHQVPASAYAVFEHKGNVETIDETYNYIFTEWVQTSQCTPTTQHIFEVYDERFNQSSDNSLVEIWVPLQVPPAQ